MGFAMARHESRRKIPTPITSWAASLTDIMFNLPGVNCGLYPGGQMQVLSLALLMPMNDRQTQVIYGMWSDHPAFTLRPFIRFGALAFPSPGRGHGQSAERGAGSTTPPCCGSTTPTRWPVVSPAEAGMDGEPGRGGPAAAAGGNHTASGEAGGASWQTVLIPGQSRAIMPSARPSCATPVVFPWRSAASAEARQDGTPDHHGRADRGGPHRMAWGLKATSARTGRRPLSAVAWSGKPMARHRRYFTGWRTDGSCGAIRPRLRPGDGGRADQRCGAIPVAGPVMVFIYMPSDPKFLRRTHRACSLCEGLPGPAVPNRRAGIRPPHGSGDGGPGRPVHPGRSCIRTVVAVLENARSRRPMAKGSGFIIAAQAFRRTHAYAITPGASRHRDRLLPARCATETHRNGRQAVLQPIAWCCRSMTHCGIIHMMWYKHQMFLLLQPFSGRGGAQVPGPGRPGHDRRAADRMPEVLTRRCCGSTTATRCEVVRADEAQAGRRPTAKPAIRQSDQADDTSLKPRGPA